MVVILFLFLLPLAFLFLFFAFWGRVSLYSLGQPQARNPSASALPALGWQACTTTSNHVQFCFYNLFFAEFFFGHMAKSNQDVWMMNCIILFNGAWENTHLNAIH